MKKITSLFLLITLLLSSQFLFSQVLPAPTNLTVGPNPGTIGVGLHWEYSLNSALFKVYRSIDSAEYSILGTAQGTMFYDNNTPSGHTYFYYVRAFNNGGMSEPSNIAHYTPSTPLPHISGKISGTTQDLAGEAAQKSLC